MRTGDNRTESSKTGFTLIELLVVIAVIAILLSILWPMAGSQVLRAKEVRCQVELKYLATASLQWSGDNSGVLPDLSRDGQFGPQLGQFTYWTWKHWKEYFTKAIGVPRDHFYSTTNPKWNRDDFWEWGGPGSGSPYVVMGRFYFGVPRNNSDDFFNRMQNKPSDIFRPLFPERQEDTSYYTMLWSDLNRQYPASAADNWVSPGDPNRWGANHLYPRRNWPLKSHVAHVDGHVSTTKGADIKHRITWQSSEIYW